MRGLVRAAFALASAAMLAPNAAAQVPSGDSAVASGTFGSDPHVFVFSANARSGPGGEDPAGLVDAFDLNFGTPAFGGPVTCLAVTDDRAIVDFATSSGIASLLLIDSTNSVFIYDARRATSECSPTGSALLIPLQNPVVVVVDAQALPTTKNQCKNGGWRDYPGFKNQGDCVSFVAAGG